MLAPEWTQYCFRVIITLGAVLQDWLHYPIYQGNVTESYFKKKLHWNLQNLTKAITDNTELNTAGHAILLWNIQDSRPENKVYHQSFQWQSHMIKAPFFCLYFWKGILWPSKLDDDSKKKIPMTKF